MNLANCKLCGAMFAKSLSSYCNTCQTKLDDRYDEYREYVKSHPGCTLLDVASYTGIPANYIQQYMKDDFTPSLNRKRSTF